MQLSVLSLVILVVIGTVTSEDYSLPTWLEPLEYDISLIPYLETPADRAFTFDGKVNVLLNVHEATSLIKLHAYNVTVHEVSLKHSSGNPLDVVDFELANNDTHFLTITLKETLTQAENYTLTMSYQGELNTALDGFYRSSFVDSKNGKTWLAATQFSPLGARRAFPCWDEPRWKAQFTLHVAHPPGYSVLSNMPAHSYSKVTELDGWTWVHHLPTPRMSTFIVGFTVSPYASLLSSTDYRFKAWSRRDVILQASYANKIAPRILRNMEEFTGVTFDLPKMDQVAIPDFAPNAMENWGMINFRETALLFEEGVSTTLSRQRVATVIAHEVAHQWFGNLVTPDSWGYVWMKEGFARYFEYHVINKLEPTWQLEEQFVQLEMRTVFQTDAINITHPMNSDVSTPASIAANFDNIAYNKGGCIIRFLVQSLGENNFMTGIHDYLKKLEYKNALPSDLWSALSPYVPESLKLSEGMNLSDVMTTWTAQGGYPVITVIRDYDDNNKGASVTQERFLSLEDPEGSHKETWLVPLTLTSAADPKFNDVMNVTAWHLGPQLEISGLPADSQQWIILNLQQVGYYRVNYDQANWALLSKALLSQTLDIHVINRAQLMDDALALARANLLDYNTALDTTSYLHLEKEYVPWTSGISSLGYIYDRLAYEAESRGLIEWYLLDKLNPLFTDLGGVTSPPEPHVTKLLRTLVLEWNCLLQLNECNNQAMELFTQWMTSIDPDVTNPIAPDLRSVVYCSGMRVGGQQEYDFLFQRYQNAKVASEQETLLKSLGCASDITLLNSLLDESIDVNSTIRSHDARTAITAVYTNNYKGVDVALDFLLQNYKRCAEVYGGFGSMGKVFAGLSSKLNTQEHRNKLQDFLDTEDLGEAKVGVEGAISTVDEILGWHDKYREMVVNYFADLKGDGNSEAMLRSVPLFTVLVILGNLIYDLFLF